MSETGTGSQQESCIQKSPLTSPKERIRALNDHLRRTGIGGMLVMTRGVDALTEEVRAEVYQELALYNNFTSDTDPYDEHDFGKITVNGIVLYWKVDYYDNDLSHLSPDPSDPNVTKRVLTLMLASEY